MKKQKMINYQDKVHDTLEKYADMGTNAIMTNAAGGEYIEIDARIRKAAEDRIYALINKRIAIPYNKDFTKTENNLIYRLVTKVLLHLTHFK